MPHIAALLGAIFIQTTINQHFDKKLNPIT